MRKTINISFPEEIDKKIKEAVEKNSFASKSEFFRYLFRRWEEEKTLKDIEESRREIATKGGKSLSSLRDLR